MWSIILGLIKTIISNKKLLLAVLGMCLFGVLYFYISTNFRLKAQLAESRQNELALSDSITSVKTTYGAVWARYAFVQNIATSLEKENAFKDQKLLAQQSTIVGLELQLHSHSDTVLIGNHDSSLTAILYPMYVDSGVTVNARDSVIFRKQNTFWNADEYSKYNIYLNLINRITRTKDGFLRGSVESQSPLIKIVGLKTVIDDQFSEAISKKLSSPAYSFGIAGDFDYNTFAGGIMFNFYGWDAQVKYIITSFSSNISNTWYNRLRFTIGRYIW